METSNSEYKDVIIKTLYEHSNKTGQSHILIRQLFTIIPNGGSKVNRLILELIREGLMEHLPDGQRSSVVLTNDGERVAGIGYPKYLNELTDKEKKHIQLLDIQEKKAIVDYDNAIRTKYKDYITIGMSAIALIISIISLINSYKK